ncbi:MAG: hypothetical protein DYG93_12415 [Leptolyngbya sp. PLA2]|nr:hypothetical protein [Leptolyngbya sp. PL-A2]MCQ3941453.1 hypothetical protein [cyanobacterium CYA1]
MTDRHQVLIETAAARDKAEALLRGLQEARARSERHLREIGQTDAMKAVTGKSSIENAIASTQRMIDTLNRSLVQLKKELTDEDLVLIESSGEF